MKKIQEKIRELMKKHFISGADLNEILGFERTSDAINKRLRSKENSYFNRDRLKKLIDSLTAEKVAELDNKYENTKKCFESFQRDLKTHSDMLETDDSLSTISLLFSKLPNKAKQIYKTKIDALYDDSLSFKAQSIWLVPDSALLKEGLPELLSSNQRLTQLQIVVSTKTFDVAKKIIQDWAVSDAGNYEDDLNIQLIGQTNRLLVEIFGFYRDGNWGGIVETVGEDGNYAILSQEGIQYLVYELEKQSSSQVAWSLSISPVSRILEALLQNMKFFENKLVYDLFSKKITYYEGQANKIHYKANDSWSTVFSLISEELVKDAEKLNTALMELKLANK